MKTFTVRSSWLAAFPEAGLDARFWYLVGKKVRQAGTRHADIAAIRSHCDAVWRTYKKPY